MKGYIVLEGKKESSRLEWTVRRVSPPAILQIPFHPKFSDPLVKPGTKVLTGQLLARASSHQGIAVYASTSGEFIKITEIDYPGGKFTKAFEVQADGKDEKAPGVGVESHDWQNYESAPLIKIFEQWGLADIDEISAPVAPKVMSDLKKGIKTIVINACEPEPYLASDYSLCMSHPLEILKGADILRRAAGADDFIIAFLDDAMEAAELFKSKIYFLKWNHAEVQTFPAVYPKGLNPVLAKDIAAQNKKTAHKKISVYNAATAFAVYEAVVLQKPFYERVVTVGGECVAQPRKLWVRTGTSVKDLIKACKGLLREPGKLILGGPMRGMSVPHQDIPVSSGVQAVLALPKEIAKTETPEACIRCGYCLDVCPEDLNPAILTLSAEQEARELFKGFGLESCIECGNCGYVCPSKRPMSEILRSAKTKL